jgi:hypothetical protein
MYNSAEACHALWNDTIDIASFATYRGIYRLFHLLQRDAAFVRGDYYRDTLLRKNTKRVSLPLSKRMLQNVTANVLQRCSSVSRDEHLAGGQLSKTPRRLYRSINAIIRASRRAFLTN